MQFKSSNQSHHTKIPSLPFLLLFFPNIPAPLPLKKQREGPSSKHIAYLAESYSHIPQQIRTSLANAGSVFGIESAQYVQISSVLTLAEKAIREYEDMTRAPVRSDSGSRADGGKVEDVDGDMDICGRVDEEDCEARSSVAKKQAPLEDLMKIFNELGLEGRRVG